jgi:hypothetical protein
VVCLLVLIVISLHGFMQLFWNADRNTEYAAADTTAETPSNELAKPATEDKYDPQSIEREFGRLKAALAKKFGVGRDAAVAAFQKYSKHAKGSAARTEKIGKGEWKRMIKDLIPVLTATQLVGAKNLRKSLPRLDKSAFIKFFDSKIVSAETGPDLVAPNLNQAPNETLLAEPALQAKAAPPVPATKTVVETASGGGAGASKGTGKKKNKVEVKAGTETQNAATDDNESRAEKTAARRPFSLPPLSKNGNMVLTQYIRRWALGVGPALPMVMLTHDRPARFAQTLASLKNVRTLHENSAHVFEQLYLLQVRCDWCGLGHGVHSM